MTYPNWQRRASKLILPKAERDFACPFRFGVTDSTDGTCCESICFTCTIAPKEYQIVISGVVNDDCNDCGSLNDTYIVPFEGQYFTWCTWLYELPSKICNLDRLEIRNYDSSFWGYYHTGISLSTQWGGSGLFFRKNRTEVKPNCMFINEDIPKGFTPDTICDDDSATCTITAL